MPTGSQLEERDELYSVSATAKRLGKERGGPTENTVRDWIKNRRLEITRVGRRVMVAESQSQNFWASCNKAK